MVVIVVLAKSPRSPTVWRLLYVLKHYSSVLGVSKLPTADQPSLMTAFLDLQAHLKRDVLLRFIDEVMVF